MFTDKNNKMIEISKDMLKKMVYSAISESENYTDEEILKLTELNLIEFEYGQMEVIGVV